MDHSCAADSLRWKLLPEDEPIAKYPPHKRDSAKDILQRKPGWRTSGGGKPVAHAQPARVELTLPWVGQLAHERASLL